MSGQHGVSGYLLQAIVATLDSLTNENWKTVSIEPNSLRDKVDIIWTLNDDSEIVYQVKSSINNFDKSDILTWILDLINDAKTAKEFKLILIGNCSGPTKSFFNNFHVNANAEKLNIKFQDLIVYRDKIIVEIKPFDLDFYDSTINSKVHKFLSEKNLKIDYRTVELIANGLKYQFLRFSTDGRKVPFTEFQKELLDWINYNYPSYLSEITNELELKFYYSGISTFSNKLSDNYIISDSAIDNLVLEAKTKLFSQILEIESIELPTTNPVDSQKKGFEVPINQRLSNLANQIPVKFDVKEIELYSNLIEKDLEIELTKDFFDLGNLKQFSQNLPFWTSSSNYSGTSDEIRKKELIDSFIINLLDLSDLINFWDKLKGFRIVPIVLKNNGSTFNESIDITLHFPSDINIMTLESFPKPKSYNILKFFNEDDSNISKLLRHSKDSKVKEYNSGRYFPILELTNSLFEQNFDLKKRNEEYKFERLIESIFDFEVFHDNENKITLMSAIDKIKPNDSISLPCYILTNSKSSFEIDYEINSTNLSAKIRGTLTVNEA